MNHFTFLEELTNKLSAIIPPSLHEFKADLENQIKGILQNTFSHLHLVTREEFDRQCAVLLRTRLKLEDLEKRMIEIEKNVLND